ncbi:MAG: alkaline phosphatase D family protein, partial [Polyangiaceae bacterium]
RVVGLRVGDSPDLAGAPIVAWALPSPVDDFTTTMTAPVAAGQPAYYRVEIDGDSSQPIRAVRAQLPDSASAVRFAYGSCTQFRPSPGFNAVNALDPDLYLFIGDNHYGNVQHVDAHRWHYRRIRRIPERVGLMSVTPTLAIWDDHDFLANNSHGACARREHALQGFTEYWANPDYGTPATPGVFFRHREGPMELFALDCRMYRPDVNDPVSYCELDPSPPTLPMASGPVGPEQMQWLMQEVASSDASFKLLACGSRFTTEGGLDSWATFPEALATLHDGLDGIQAEGVVFLSGDIHRSRFRLNPRPNGYPIPELTSSPLSRTSPASSVCPAEPGEIFCYRDNSFVVLDVTTDDLTATIYDEGGTSLYTWTITKSELSY